MANTVKFTVTQKEIDEDQNVVVSETFIVNASYTNYSKGLLSVPSVNMYRAISFGNVTTSTCIRLTCDQQVTIKLNGGSEEIIIDSDFISTVEATALSIKNDSGYDANIVIQIYGN